MDLASLLGTTLPPQLSQTGLPPQFTSAVQPRPPMPAPPQMPSVPQVQAGSSGTNVLGVLSQLAPMVMAAFRARKDPQGSAALMQGLIRGHEVARAQQLDREKREQEKREFAARYLQQVASDATQFDDVEEFNRFLSYHEPVAQTLGIDSAKLRQIPFATSKAAEKKRKLASERIASLESDPRWAHLVGTPEFENGFSVEVPGLGVKTVKELRALAQHQVFDPQGKTVAPRGSIKQAPLSDYEGFLLRFARERGKTPETLTASDEVEARKLWGTADNRPTPPPALGSFEDYVARKFGANPTAAQIEQARKAYGQADDRPPVVIGAGGYSPAVLSYAKGLADDYRTDSKEFIVRAESYGTVKSAAKDASPAGDLSLIFAYMKMLDPGSTVREGEFANAQNAAAVPDQIRNAYNRVMSGTRLNPNQRADFVRQAENLYRTSKTRHDRITQSYTERARRAGINPADVILDYGIGDDTPTPAATTPRRIYYDANGNPIPQQGKK